MIATFFTKIRPKNDMIFPESSVHILKDIAVRFTSLLSNEIVLSFVYHEL